jgi:hypothetical protein
MSASKLRKPGTDRREAPARHQREDGAKRHHTDIDQSSPPVEYQPESGALAPRDPFQDPDARDPRDDI